MTLASTGKALALDKACVHTGTDHRLEHLAQDVAIAKPAVRQTRAVAEFLTAFDEEGADAERKLPKVISPVDPCSAWTAKANKRVQFGYGLNYLIESSTRLSLTWRPHRPVLMTRSLRQRR